MLLHDIYWRGPARDEIDKFCQENPSTDKATITRLSFLLIPIWRNASYFLIKGVDNQLEQKLHSALWKKGASYKVLQIGGITALNVAGNSMPSVEPLLSNLEILHKGTSAADALLAALPLVK